MTPPQNMERSLEPLLKHIQNIGEFEWTMEANPSSVDMERLKGYQKLGVNRVSMGVQALKNDLLKTLGRVHDRDAAIRALHSLFESGLKNVSVDLLCGVPGQSKNDIEAFVDELLSFPITHLSCYLLTLPEHHKLYSHLPNEDEQLEHLLFLDQIMQERGFEHYEISNFSRPGFRAQHNLGYWKGESYLGLGPSAHSFCKENLTRWKNVSSIHRYADLLQKGTPPLDWEEKLTPEQRHIEKWMLAIRLEEGFPRQWLEESDNATIAANLEREGLLENHPKIKENQRLTARGFALSDQILQQLI